MFKKGILLTNVKPKNIDFKGFLVFWKNLLNKILK